MNERIRELSRQAWVCHTTEYQVNGVKTHRTYKEVFSPEKFAELIVKECAGLARGYMQRVHRNDGRDLGVHIKQHFGVEE